MIHPAIHILYGEAVNYADKASYVSDCALSSAWGDDPTEDTARICGNLWDIYTDGIKAIVAASGKSGRALAAAYGIPYRTYISWTQAERVPPAYLLLLLAQDQGML